MRTCKISVLSLLWISLCVRTGMAAPVDENAAVRVGLTYLATQKSNDKGGISIAGEKGAGHSIQAVQTLFAEDPNITLAYVLTLSPTGYIVVSPDTDVAPLIAYSFKDAFPFGDANSPLVHMVTWDMDNRLKAIPLTSDETKADNHALWEDYTEGSNKLMAQLASVQEWGPWVKTTWDQGSPYNKFCPCLTSIPLIGCLARGAVGCSATAMAQIVNYWKYPDSVQFAPADRYVTKTLGIKIDQDADTRDFPDFAELNGMLLDIDYSNTDEISALCFACGVVQKMDYQVDWWFLTSSGAVPEARAFTEKFKYSSAVDKDSSAGDFYTTLIKNMKEAEPSLLAIFKKRGNDLEEGHAIVADGYKETGEYHLNFGWSGSSDGWYFLPNGLPSGYNVVSYAVLDIRPVPLERSTIDKGIDWLRTHWQDQGGGKISWAGDPAVTSFAVLTMINWGYTESDDLVSRGMNYVRSFIHPDGSVYSNINRSTYYTAIAILPLAATHNQAYREDIRKMREWLIALQWDESSFYGSVDKNNWYYGGFGYGSNTRPDLSNTQWALMGLKAADKELGLDAMSTYDKCADYFLARCQNSDGGSAYVPYSGSIHTMTAASVWSYALCGRGNSNQAKRGMQWLEADYSLTNKDGWGWWSEYYYKVTLAKALTMTHKAKLGEHDWFTDLAQKLADEQYDAGNWPDTGMMGTEMSTCWAILALQTKILPPGVETTMWIELRSHADVHVYDPQGRHMGPNYETKSIDQEIPGATFKILDSAGNEVPYTGQTPGDGLRQVVYLPDLVAGSYRIELVGTSNGPFDLIIKGLQDGAEVTSKTFSGNIADGDWLATNVTVTAMEGALTLLYEPLVALPVLGVDPDEIKLTVKPGTIADATFTVKERSGNETLHSVSAYCTDITGPGGTIAGSSVTFDVSGFDVPPGGEQTVHMTVPIPAGFGGIATGRIVVESANGGTRAIDVTVTTKYNLPPHAEAGGPYHGAVGQPIMFSAHGSYDMDGGAIETYMWDWWMDNRLEYRLGPLCEHTWHSGFSGKVRLYIYDDEYEVDWAEADVIVTGPQNMLRLVLQSHADLHLYDPRGTHVGINYQTGVLETQVPGSSFQVLDAQGNVVPWTGGTPGEGLRQVISLPVYAGGKYCLKLVGTSDGPFELEVAGTQDGQLVAQKVYSGDILKGEVIPLCLTAQFAEGALRVELPALVYPPVMQVAPVETTLSVEAAKSYTCPITIKEVRGVTPLQGVTLACAEVKGPAPGIRPSDITFDLSGFEVAAGGEQVVHASISVPNGFMGKTTAVIVVKAANGGEKRVSIVLKTPGKLLPFASAGGPYHGVAGEPITFDAGRSYDPDGEVAFYGWDWNADDEIDEYAYTPTCRHTWSSAGTRTVRLFIYDEDNMINWDDAKVVVEPVPAP